MNMNRLLGKSWFYQDASAVFTGSLELFFCSLVEKKNCLCNIQSVKGGRSVAQLQQWMCVISFSLHFKYLEVLEATPKSRRRKGETNIWRSGGGRTAVSERGSKREGKNGSNFMCVETEQVDKRKVQWTLQVSSTSSLSLWGPKSSSLCENAAVLHRNKWTSHLSLGIFQAGCCDTTDHYVRQLGWQLLATSHTVIIP